MKLVYRIFAGILVVLLMAGCAQPGFVNNGLSGDLDSSLYVENLMKSKGQNSITLDLADEYQYRYIKELYLSANLSADNSPELFTELEEARTVALESKRSFTGTRTISQTPYIKTRDFMVSNLYTDGCELFTTLTSTVMGGTSSSTVYLRILDSNNKILTPGSGGWIIKTESARGQALVLNAKIPLSSLDSSGLINIQAMERLVINNIPYFKTTAIATLVTGERLNLMEPSDKNRDGKIVVALDESAIAADYPATGQSVIKIPFKGSLKVPYRIGAANINKSNSYIKISDSTKGGTTAMNYQGLDNYSFADSLKLTAGPDNSTIIEWDISIADGLFNNSELFRKADKVNWYLSLNLINVEYLPGKINHFTYAASSDIGEEQLPSYYPTYLTFQ